jgi:hypothetical protein
MSPSPRAFGTVKSLLDAVLSFILPDAMLAAEPMVMGLDMAFHAANRILSALIGFGAHKNPRYHET